MKVAIVGGGIAGLYAMHLVHRRCDAMLFEAAPAVGGHVHTVDVTLDGRSYAIDSGFIVYNDVTYPRFSKLIQELGVATQPTSMSFSVRDDESGIEYSTRSLLGWLAQPRNLLRSELYAVLRDVMRFRNRTRTVLEGAPPSLTLAEHLESEGYSRAFVDLLVLPLSAAIWSADPSEIGRFPLVEWLGFIERHGMLRIAGRPRWRVICGGARRYLDALVQPFRDRIRVSKPVERVERSTGGVWIVPRDGEPERFDEVIIATHSDQALAMLEPATDAEHAALSAIVYRASDVVLHHDTSVLPRSRRAWAAWNYHRPSSVTYNLSMLAGIDGPTFCVTLNRSSSIDPDKVIEELRFSHPCYSAETFAAQRAIEALSGRDRIHFCGAYLGYGFHEDAVASAHRAAASFTVQPSSAS